MEEGKNKEEGKNFNNAMEEYGNTFSDQLQEYGDDMDKLADGFL